MKLKGTLILFFVLVGTVDALSQFKNILLDEQLEGSTGACDPTVAINPRYPNNIIAGSHPGNVYVTKDAGKTWTKKKMTSAFGISGDPTVVVDEKGNFFYLHISGPTSGQGGEETGRFDRIQIHKSDDGGNSWAEGESIGLNPPKEQSRQRAAIDSRGNLFVAWTQFDKYGDADPGCQSNVLFSMSKNGKKWTNPVTISQTAGNCADDDNTPEGAVPAVSFDGKVFVAWSSEEKIFLDRSFNGGEWWLSNDIVVGEQKGGWNLMIPGHTHSNGMPVLMSDHGKSQYRGSLYVAWADQRNGENDTDIWFSRSHNFGDNWSMPARVNNDPRGKHQYMPSMTVDAATGYVYILYYDRREHDDNRTDVYLAYSNDGGASFKNVKISENSFVPQAEGFFGDCISVSAHKGTIAPVWTRMDNRKTSIWTAVISQQDLDK